MSVTCTVVVDDGLRAYDFGPAHPLGPIRLQLTFDALRAAGLLDQPEVLVTAVTESLAPAELEAVHTAQYVAAVKAASQSSADGRHVAVRHATTPRRI